MRSMRALRSMLPVGDLSLSLSLSLCIHAVAVGRWCDVVCDCADMLGLAIWFVGMAMEATADNLKLASYQHDTPRCA